MDPSRQKRLQVSGGRSTLQSRASGLMSTTQGMAPGPKRPPSPSKKRVWPSRAPPARGLPFPSGNPYVFSGARTSGFALWIYTCRFSINVAPGSARTLAFAAGGGELRATLWPFQASALRKPCVCNVPRPAVRCRAEQTLPCCRVM